MGPENLLDLIDAWVQWGWLRPLDRALVRFFKEQQPDCHDTVLFAAALTSHQLGRGHICLDLQAVMDDFEAVLALPPEGQWAGPTPDKPAVLLSGLSGQVWGAFLQESALVDTVDGNAPLVLSAGRLYLRRYWQYTQQVASGIRRRLQARIDVPDDLPHRLDRLFASLRSPEETDKTEIHWQSVAAVVAAASPFAVISGGPGTGKTTTVVRILWLLQEMALEQGRPLRIHLAAPTGKAAARLTQALGEAVEALPEAVRAHIPSEAATLHRLLGSRPDSRHFVHHRQNPLHCDLLVVDEASMIDLEMMAALVDALPERARLILLGDKDQLASVEAGSVLGDLCRHAQPVAYWPETVAWIQKNTGYGLQAFQGQGARLVQHIVLLQKSHRFGPESGIGALAAAVNSGDGTRVAAMWEKGYADITRLTLSPDDPAAFARLVIDGTAAFHEGAATRDTVGYGAYLARLQAGRKAAETETAWLQSVLDRFQRFQLLSPLRKGDWGVQGLNDRIADILFHAGLITTTTGWYSGRPVMVTRNDYGLGLMNGDIGVAMPVGQPDRPDPNALRVVFPLPDGTLKKVLPSRLNDVETVYAMTVHKSQGSEFEHAVMVLPDRPSPVLTRELIYTGITRASRRFTLAGPEPDLLDRSVPRQTHRASGLGDLLVSI
ncbi:MAG: exodeoxyribonuclease V subunit alpha [Desulfobacterales bacterium]|nr:exodeoxyribonuclease V subunit alpha [Desulfobacterales bacterium]